VALQPADREIEVAALELGVEVRQQRVRVGDGRAYVRGSGPFAQPADEVFVDRLGHASTYREAGSGIGRGG
jgi:hypothetical protein